MKNDKYNVYLSKGGLKITKNNKPLIEVKEAVKVSIDKETFKLTPQSPLLPVCSFKPAEINLSRDLHKLSPAFKNLKINGIFDQDNRKKVLKIGGKTKKIKFDKKAPELTMIICDKEFAVCDNVRPDEDIIVCGYAFDGRGVPEERMFVALDEQMQIIETNNSGWFACMVNSGCAGKKKITVSSGSKSIKKQLTAEWHILRHMDEFLTVPLTIVYGSNLRHAQEIALRILLQKNIRVKLVKKYEENGGNKLILTKNMPRGIKYAGKNYGYRKKDGIIEVWLKTGNDVFADVNDLIFDMVNNSKPIRPLAINCYLNWRELAYRYGEKTDDKLPVKVTGNKDIDLYMNGKISNGKKYKGELDLNIKGSKSVEAKKPYIALTPIKKELPPDTIKDSIFELEIEGDSDTLTDARIEIKLPFNYIISNGRFGKQWPRIDDPVRLLRKPDGTVILSIEFHPGGGIHSWNKSNTYPETKRNIRIEFIKLRI